MRPLPLLIVLLVAAAGTGVLAPVPALAHGVGHAVDRAEAVTVRFTYPDGSPLAFADYQVHGPEDPRPAVAGLTDRDGRVVFVPDRSGAWTVSVTTVDGHGAEVAVDVAEDALTVAAADGGPGRGLRTLLGLALIALVCVVLAAVLRRSAGTGKGSDPAAGAR
jgi:nickel transport protein